MSAAFRIVRVEAQSGVDGVARSGALRFEGRLTFEDGGALWAELHPKGARAVAGPLVFDLSGLDSVDGGAMALLVQTKWDLQTAGTDCTFSGAMGDVQKLLALYQGESDPIPARSPVSVGFFGDVGAAVVAVLLELQAMLGFVGSVVVAGLGVIRRPRTGNWRDVGPIMASAGADAVPIVSLITFLIGFVMAFQSAVQLKQFGANIYVADMVALSLTRELGPLMTAIIVCGRSGAAFAAELGTMKVSEEIDALRTMGIGPLRFLVLPRVVALLLVLPVLTLMGDLVGIIGGLLVGVVNLDLTITAYLQQTQRAIDLWDVSQGLVKSGVFALAIGLISCAQGLATTGGAEGVGRRTTKSVVTSLFALIVIDALFTLAFHKLGL